MGAFGNGTTLRALPDAPTQGQPDMLVDSSHTTSTCSLFMFLSGRVLPSRAWLCCVLCLFVLVVGMVFHVIFDGGSPPLFLVPSSGVPAPGAVPSIGSVVLPGALASASSSLLGPALFPCPLSPPPGLLPSPVACLFSSFPPVTGSAQGSRIADP